MKITADALHSFTPTDDALVLAAVDSPAEVEMLDAWLAARRQNHPDARIEVLQLPTDGEPAPATLARLVELLDVDEGRSVVPVRVFWIPGGLPTRSKVVAFLSGRDTYRPPKLLQRNILRKDSTRARVVAG
ncbi:MAG: glycerol-3-phosphate acyltransferase, partial [Actinomycetota bacterium]|nr:glycerol-3-phosphate acyltransferase [Actinomycetota bacterium]